MAGYASIEDQGHLAPGASCILYVNDVNRPFGWWRGAVVSSGLNGEFLIAEARIVGRLSLMDGGELTTNDECQGIIPSVNYTVIAPTSTVRTMLKMLLSAERLRQDAVAETALWRRTHLETMEYLSRHGVAVDPPEEQ